jgi:hypothetical protein
MKESSDDINTKRIKEVLEQYEPDYSPQFWENLRKQRPSPEFHFNKLFLKYRFYLSCLIITGLLFIVYMDTNILPADKYPAIDPVFPESSNSLLSETPQEIAYSEKTAMSGRGISNIGTIREGINISPKVTPVRTTVYLPVTYQNYTQTANEVEELPGVVEQDPVNPIILKEVDFSSQCDILQLIPIKYQADEIPALKSPSSYRTKKFKLQWPGSDFMQTEEGSYDKFTGPNRLAFFYSPEIHYCDSLSKLGVSQGAGISFEGSIRSSVSVSAGLSFQSMNFDVTISSYKVPPEGPFLPVDTNQTINNIDSINIRSGSYKFLELPVAVNFKFIESPRSQFWLSTGISAIAFLQQNYTYETVVGGISNSSSVSVKAWENIHPLASFNIGLLCRYELSDRFFLYGSAQYKQHLVPLGYNSMKLNRLNFQAGIIYRFGHKGK